MTIAHYYISLMDWDLRHRFSFAISNFCGEMSNNKGRKVQSRVVTENKEEVEFSTTDGVNVLPTFDAMGLKEDLLRGIYAYGIRMRMNYLWIYSLIWF